MSNFQKYIATEQRTYPSVDLTAVPGFVYDFGTLPVPGDGRWQSDAGPATGVFDNTVSVTAGNVIGRSGGYVYTTSGPPTTGNFAPPMLAYDLTGNTYGCVGSGNPGTWVLLVANGTGTSVSPPTTFTTEAAPDGTQRIKTETSNGKTITYSYDDANGGRISGESDGTTSRTYSYDGNGVLTGIA